MNRYTLKVGNTLLDYSQPLIMGILNITEDSFYDGGQYTQVESAMKQVQLMLDQGADIIDVGAFSSRPGAHLVPSREQLSLLKPIVAEMATSFPEVILSIDCFHGAVVNDLSTISPFIVNDITGFSQDPTILDALSSHGCPYVLMHMRGTPDDMQTRTAYTDVVFEVIDDLIAKIYELNSRGIDQIIIDPGFGFAKTSAQNFEMLRKLGAFDVLERPIMVGVSRKSMIYKTLSTDPHGALNGTTALHMAALMNGADILRVHDVKEAVETRTLWSQLQFPVKH